MHHTAHARTHTDRTATTRYTGNAQRHRITNTHLLTHTSGTQATDVHVGLCRSPMPLHMPLAKTGTGAPQPRPHHIADTDLNEFTQGAVRLRSAVVHNTADSAAIQALIGNIATIER